ncbi:hypothetical protein A946_08090 [Methylacidiphilum kamchatkense Kam1]|uniref:EamA-like transporter family protein n=1 Tax=Methylacidiphilum kamchatkense Kam1 TaxID=1202785 RepID=A0A0C1UNK3_9BACT|nr:hypothetical protein [Methylacidiphilum kamchatkense]KIE58144.1 hypothetical protein A946_08090 [Methylacidiphilum kamchatkense Kam1]QDQ42164.1 hypothetical protein kam1_925 [Methylacidiphilum kamchatkense Kam1]
MDCFCCYLLAITPTPDAISYRNSFQGYISISLLLLGSSIASYFAIQILNVRKLKAKPDTLSLVLFSIFALFSFLGMLFWKPIPEDYRWIGILLGLSLLLLLIKRFSPRTIHPKILPSVLIPSGIVSLHYLVHEKIEFLIVFFVTMFALGVVKELKN